MYGQETRWEEGSGVRLRLRSACRYLLKRSQLLCWHALDEELVAHPLGRRLALSVRRGDAPCEVERVLGAEA